MLNRVRAAAAPPPDLSISAWANEFLYLPRSVAAEPGKYYTSRMPWQKEMLDSVTGPTVGENVWLMAKQTSRSLQSKPNTFHFVDVAHPPTSSLCPLDSAPINMILITSVCLSRYVC